MNKRTTLSDMFYNDMSEGTKNHEIIFLTIHYDEWKEPNSTERTQRHIQNVRLDEALKEYGNWIYENAYTTERSKDITRIDVWLMATDDRKYSQEYRDTQKDKSSEIVENIKTIISDDRKTQANFIFDTWVGDGHSFVVMDEKGTDLKSRLEAAGYRVCIDKETNFDYDKERE